MIEGLSPDQALPLAYGTTFGKAVPHWAMRSIRWSQFCRLLEKPATSKTGALSYLPGTITPGPGNKCKCSVFLHRTKKTVVSRWAITLDADYCGNAGSALVRNVERLQCAFAMHTTWSSTEDDERYRLIIPLDREVAPLEYSALARYMMDVLGRGMFDATCEQPSRLMYLPSSPNPDTYWLADRRNYPLLDVEFWLDLAGGPDVVEPRQEIEVAVGELTSLQKKQLRGLVFKVGNTEEGNRDSVLLWALKAAVDSGMDPDIAGPALAKAGMVAGLDEDVCWEKVGRVLG